jgi:hypothetical protein
LVDPKENVVNGRFIEAQMVCYYQRMDTQDLVAAGTISDIEERYLLLSDFGSRALYSIYCERYFDIFLRIKFSLSWKFGETPYH